MTTMTSMSVKPGREACERRCKFREGSMPGVVLCLQAAPSGAREEILETCDWFQGIGKTVPSHIVAASESILRTGLLSKWTAE